MTTSSRAETGSRRVPRRSRLLRRAAWVVGTLAATVIAVIVAGLPLYVFPSQGDPTGADLVYVIGPPQRERLELAATLRDANGHTPLLISVPDYQDGRGSAADDATSRDVCGEEAVTCETPAPFTTAGETKLLTDYATTHEVGKTVVITFTPHVARTRYIFAKCYAGDVTVVGVATKMSLSDWAYQYAYQTAAFVKAWFTPCP